MRSIIQKLFWVSRPISWPNTAYPFGAAYLVSGGTLDLTFWVAALFFLVPYNLLMYGVNDVFDYESDIKNPRKGGIEGMREQRAFHPVILWASTLLPIPFLLYLFMVGTFVSNILLAVTIFFVISYSLAGLRFKEKPVLDSITSSIHFVGPMVYGLSFAGFSSESFPYILAFFLWGVASHAFGAVQDIVPDRQGGISSIATIFGAKITVRLAITAYAAASLLLLVQNTYAAIIGIVGLIYVINIISYFSITDEQSGATNKAWRRFIWLNLITGFAVTMVLLHLFLG